MGRIGSARIIIVCFWKPCFQIWSVYLKQEVGGLSESLFRQTEQGTVLKRQELELFSGKDDGFPEYETVAEHGNVARLISFGNEQVCALERRGIESFEIIRVEKIDGVLAEEELGR